MRKQNCSKVAGVGRGVRWWVGWGGGEFASDSDV